MRVSFSLQAGWGWGAALLCGLAWTGTSCVRSFASVCVCVCVCVQHQADALRRRLQDYQGGAISLSLHPSPSPFPSPSLSLSFSLSLSLSLPLSLSPTPHLSLYHEDYAVSVVFTQGLAALFVALGCRGRCDGAARLAGVRGAGAQPPEAHPGLRRGQRAPADGQARDQQHRLLQVPRPRAARACVRACERACVLYITQFMFYHKLYLALRRAGKHWAWAALPYPGRMRLMARCALQSGGARRLAMLKTRLSV